MINKFETVGILGSIALMSVALFLLRVEKSVIEELQSDNVNQAAVAVVSGDNDRNEIFNTLVDSVDHAGNLNKLIIDDVIEGEGRAVEVGDTVFVNYVGRLENGQEFDNSYNRGQAFSFTVGAGRVIEGWEEGILGMKVGGQRILVIPPEMGYGAKNIGPIPANSTLIFAIELVSINE